MDDQILKPYTYLHLSQENKDLPIFYGCEVTHKNFDNVIKAILVYSKGIRAVDDTSVLITNIGMEQQMYLKVGDWIFLDKNLKLFSVPCYLVKFLFTEVKQ